MSQHYFGHFVTSIQNKKDLKQKYPDSVRGFHAWCPVCYNFYDYNRWLNLNYSDDSTEVGYTVSYELYFEPYFLGEVWNFCYSSGHLTVDPFQFSIWKPNLASNKNLPYHDSRFRGYGGNKVIHALLLSHQKYEFKVLSNPFLIHNGIKEATSGRSLVEQKLNGKECLIKFAVECRMNATKEIKILISEFYETR